MTEHSEHETSRAPVLWHYTDIGGLHGILESATLWGTHAKFLNDIREMIHGYEYFRNMSGQLFSWENISGAINNEHIWRPETSIVARLGGRVALALGISKAAGQVSELFMSGGAGPFVTCLSGACDQLGQWRGYAGDGGYAIGFDRERLEASVKPKMGRAPAGDYALDPLPLGTSRLVKIRYLRIEEKSESKEIDNAINSLIASLEQRADGPSAAGEQIMQNLPEFILQFLTELKDPAFEEEDEHRIITFGFPDMFHPSPIGLIPRLGVEFDPDCVAEVRVGPGGDRKLRKFSIDYFLKHDPRYSHVKVNESDVPFRGALR